MKKHFILLILAVSFFACEETNNVIENKDVLIPLKPGNKWVYQTTRNNMIEGELDTLEKVIGEKVTINGVTGYKVSEEKAPFDATFITNNDPFGNVLNIGGFSTIDTLIKSSVQFRINAMPGEVWEFTNVILHYDNGTFEEKIIEIKCLSTDTLISVPKGDFICMAFEYTPNSGANIFKIFISKNIGIVKTEQFEENNLFFKMDLIDYKF